MAESTRARNSRAAKQARAGAEGKALAKESRWASRRSLADSQGPLVIEAILPEAELALLVRRPNLLAMLNAGIFVEPITSMVRQMMLFGPSQVETDHGREKFEDTGLALMRATVIVPPPELLAGEVDVAGITREMCKPLFVAPGETPDADQMILVPASDETPDPDGLTCRFQGRDITFFVFQMLEARSGAAARFRPAGQVEADAVAAGGEMEGDGGVGEAVTAAAA